MTHTRWMYSMAGEEFARIYSWGNDPMRQVKLAFFLLLNPPHALVATVCGAIEHLLIK